MKFAQYKLILQLGQRENLSFLSVENLGLNDYHRERKYAILRWLHLTAVQEFSTTCILVTDFSGELYFKELVSWNVKGVL